MITRTDFKPWILEALQSLGCKGYPKDVAKYIWEKKKHILQNSGDILYTWQYDTRWAALALRKEGKLKAVDGRKDLPWEIA
ncbi:hypothetical protein CUZ56_01123 [Saezia sanguinis]|uniref:Uncharacterized protein n=1 Tax=Saezia sanguinis TaxID=1965230 RepID=A0A433SEM9_9BURK|nr:hypothetical protein [Saezia sanguinis]RUS67182.1 hypothetical protein CUZ56_01123 [Saezia sanguinis]